jgi:EmrB/QacA subfamily drug resistance transporter
MEKKNSSKWVILIIITVGFFMAKLDMSIVNLAITKMMTSFNATFDQIQWVLSAYTLSLGIVMATTGYLSDRFGTKKIFNISLVLFTAGSLLCGIAWNTASIIIFRIIQGVGGGLLMPVGMALLLTTFEESERGTVFAIMGIGTLVAPALGPTLGGYLIENLDWRSVFFINLPVGVAGIILTYFLLPESEHKSSRSFDLTGFVTSSVGLGCILYVLGKNDIDWTDKSNILFLIVGVFSLAIFIVNELMTDEPMLNIRLMKDYNFCVGNIMMNIGILALFGGIFLVPIYLQQLKGLTPFQTGMILFPEAITSAISMLIASKLMSRMDGRIFLFISLCLLAFNSYNMTFVTFDTSNAEVTMLLLIRGLGFGFLVVPIQYISMSTISKESMANATSLFQTIMQVGSSISITIITTVMQQRNNVNYANLSAKVNPLDPETQNLLKILHGMLINGGMQPSDAQAGAVSQIFGFVVKQAMLQALNDTMFIIMIISLLAILPAFLLKKSAGGGEMPVGLD